MYRGNLRAAVWAGIFLLIAAAGAPAQWVMVGRAAANRIQHMTQRSGNGGYDVATVLLEAAPERVYETALKTLKANPEITVTKEDGKKGKLQFRKGNLVAGLQITPVAEKVTQLVIASSVGDETHPSATPLVLDRLLRVCQEMNVKCSVQSE